MTKGWLGKTLQIGFVQLASQRSQCLQRVKTGSPAWASECPLSGVKRKSISGDWMSVHSHNRTFEHAQEHSVSDRLVWFAIPGDIAYDIDGIDDQRYAVHGYYRDHPISNQAAGLDLI